jgi:hypothetical protein
MWWRFGFDVLFALLLLGFAWVLIPKRGLWVWLFLTALRTHAGVCFFSVSSAKLVE